MSFKSDFDTVNKNGYRVDSAGLPEHVYMYFFFNPQTPKKDGWHIHHVNGEKLDNSINNLFYLPGPLHFLIHRVCSTNGYKLPNRKRLELFRAYYCESLSNDPDEAELLKWMEIYLLRNPSLFHKKKRKRKNKKRIKGIFEIVYSGKPRTKLRKLK